jgi:hypothetical protein
MHPFSINLKIIAQQQAYQRLTLKSMYGEREKEIQH